MKNNIILNINKVMSLIHKNKVMSLIHKFWNIQPPVRPKSLNHQVRWDGESITPYHQHKQVLRTIKEDDEVSIITPIHKENKRITRAYGDILSDEVEI